jgi:predicted nucleotidyltransferase component of viral defense system
MIERKELITLAKQTGINHAELFETEYMNGLLIDAMSRVLTKDEFAIHGGTCRNKAYNGMAGIYTKQEIDEYFQRNRFSKDIDSYIVPKFNNEKTIREILNEAALIISKGYDIKIKPQDIRIMAKQAPRSHPFRYPRVDVRIPYVGPMANEKHGLPGIKLTLDSDDGPILPTTRQMIYHPFSDKTNSDLVGNCFSFIELFARKMFVMYDRKEGRDLYDIAILSATYDIMSHLEDVRAVLYEKARRYDTQLPTSLSGFEEVLRLSWDNKIKKTVQNPLPFGQCMKQLRIIFEKIGHTKTSLAMSVLNRRNIKCV